jgi:N-acetylglucosaminyl-diphospho-decaprenol L-rhamnosyltransferase
MPSPRSSSSDRGPLSVIVPVHNRGDLARQCLAGLARWTTPLEIIVVDDGSTDPGVDLLRQAGLAHQWLRNPEAQGFSAAINRGLEQATGDPLLLLNSDAEVTEGGDRLIREAFEPGRFADSGAPGRGSGAVGALAARLVYPNGRPQWSGGAFPNLLWLFALASGLGRGARWRAHRRPPSGFTGGVVDWAPAAAFALARSAWEAVGRFDESYSHYAQDLDYCQRLATAGRSVRVLADWVVVHHLGGSVGHVEGRCDSAGTDPVERVSTPASSYDGQRLDLLWLDLLHWARRHRGEAWARKARRTLLLGGRLRRLMLASRGGGGEALAVTAALAAIAASAASGTTRSGGAGAAAPPRDHSRTPM